MESTEQKDQGTFHDTERSPNLTNINRLPDDMLLEIFDFYRQSTDDYDLSWKKKYEWLNLAHVYRRWGAVMFASSSRLDLNVVVGPIKPGHIKSILSSPLPIIIDYSRSYKLMDASALSRLCSALEHRDRVREISFEGLVLWFPHDHEPDIPATFLRGSDRSDLHLRHLGLYGGSLAFLSGLLLSVTAFTDLTLNVTSYTAIFDPSQGSSFLACLQGMQCLRSLDLMIPYCPQEEFQPQGSQDLVPKDTTVQMSELRRFHYSGLITFLNDLMSGLSAPSLQDVRFMLCTNFRLLYLPRVIDDVREEFRSVSVTIHMDHFHLLSSTHSEEIDHFKPSSFKFNVNCSPHSINSMRSTPSTKFAMAEELTLNFSSANLNIVNLGWNHTFSVREFLRQFRSVKLLRVNPFVPEVGLCFQQGDDEEAIMPLLEEVEISIRCSDEEYQRCETEALAAFEHCERAGRLVKVYHSVQTQTQASNARSW